jgi:hypothetical protein
MTSFRFITEGICIKLSLLQNSRVDEWALLAIVESTSTKLQDTASSNVVYLSNNNIEDILLIRNKYGGVVNFQWPRGYTSKI